MHFTLDTQGLICPMPLLKLKMLLKQCHAGDSIQQMISDPTSAKDIPAWLENKGYKVLITQQNQQLFVLDIKVVS